MKVTGSAVLHAPPERVWAAFTDPEVLVRTIPGCQRLETIGEDHYRMTVQAGVAAIKGAFSGEVRLHDQQPPESLVMTARGAGAPGTIRTEVRVRLGPDGTGSTRLEYDADADVGGTIAGVGQRVLAGAARRTAQEFFANVDGVLTGAVPAAAPEPAPAAAPAATGPAAAPAEGREFVAPPPPVAPSRDFARGVALGAGIALLGALVGGWVAGRRNR